MSTYKITCLKCNTKEELRIDDSTHQVLGWGKKAETNILAARFRGDGQFGFECVCGNDNRLAASEKDSIKTLVQGDKISIEKIISSLKIADNKQFAMEVI